MMSRAQGRLRDGHLYVGEARLVDGVLTMPAARLRGLAGTVTQVKPDAEVER